MRRYRRNTALADVIKSHPEAGLPLFAESTPSPSGESSQAKGRGRGGVLTRRQRALLNAPRALEHAEGTRRLARQAVTFDPEALAQKQLVVYEELRKHPNATNGEIAAALGWSVHRVVGRMFELRELGFVVADERRACKQTGFICQTWRTIKEEDA